jgi:hypothetical protein
MINKMENMIDFGDDDYRPTIFDRIKWWLQDARYYHKGFVTGIKNLYKWFPVIWKDRDWDSHYIFEVLKFKIIKQSKYIGGNDRHTRAKRDTEIMMTVSRLIQMVQDETYAMEYTDYHKTRHYFEPSKELLDGKKMYEWKSEQKSENFDEYFKKYPRQYNKVISGELNLFNKDDDGTKNKHTIAMEIAHENQERCKRLLFKILEREILKWWD